ncbi:MAG TPA: hypothetical protein VNI02_11995 [Blastocatellia bacterium]|jgi:photosystem II stability/assembly factor-like uncharacterized protein|nr:hypothetical protein [Blastocatellia bacterium]
MKFSRRSISARAAALRLLCALLFMSGNLFISPPVGQKKNSGMKAAPLLLPAEFDLEAEPGGDDDPEGRSDWFLFQRAYPSDSIPPDARAQAWESIPKFRAESLTPQAAPGWRAIGPASTWPLFRGNWGLTSGRVNSVAVSPSNSRVVLAGSATGGIWRSGDGGATFSAASDDQVDLAVGSIAFSKSNPSIAYAGMGDTKLGYLGSGVLKSTDEGRTWRKVSNNSLPSPGTISRLDVDPADPNRVYVAQYAKLAGARTTSSGFYRSTDGGVSWGRTQAGAPRDLAVDPANPRNLYLGLSRIERETDPPFGLYRSTDRGDTWSSLFTTQYEVKSARDIRVAVTAADPKTIYVYMGGFGSLRFEALIKASTDGGATWVDRNASGFDLGQFGYNSFIAADPRDAGTVYVGSRDLYKSTDGGINWTNLTLNYTPADEPYSYTPSISKAHPDQHALAFAPGNSNQFYIGNDGGISKTTDGGGSFQSLNATLNLTQFTSIAIHPTDASITYGGTQDNGTQRRFPGSDQWYEIVSGDGGRVVINPLNTGTVFSTYVRGMIFRFYDDGRYFDTQVAWNSSFNEPESGARIAFYPPFTGNGVDSTLYFGTWRLFVSANLGEIWSAPAGGLDLTKGLTDKGWDVLSAIGIGRANTDIIYTGSAQGRAMVSTDGGANWTDATRGLPDRFITSITVDPANSAIAYLAVSGFNSGHVFKTTDAGATWSDISGNLPDIPANALLIDPLNSSTIYAGTDIGVFRSAQGDANWRDFTKGMPPVVVQAFSAQAGGLVQVATYGRGAFELVGNERPSITSVTFDGKKRLEITGRALDNASRVLINETDQTDRISSTTDATVKLKGKSKKLGLKEGDNTIQIINSNDAASNIFILKLT